MKPIIVHDGLAKTTIQLGRCNAAPMLDATVRIRIERVGQPNNFVEYESIDATDDGRVVFYWDDVLRRKPAGVYVGRLDDPCKTCIKFIVPRPCGVVSIVNEDRTSELDCEDY